MTSFTPTRKRFCDCRISPAAATATRRERTQRRRRRANGDGGIHLGQSSANGDSGERGDGRENPGALGAETLSSDGAASTHESGEEVPAIGGAADIDLLARGT